MNLRTASSGARIVRSRISSVSSARRAVRRCPVRKIKRLSAEEQHHEERNRAIAVIKTMTNKNLLALIAMLYVAGILFLIRFGLADTFVWGG